MLGVVFFNFFSFFQVPFTTRLLEHSTFTFETWLRLRVDLEPKPKTQNPNPEPKPYAQTLNPNPTPNPYTQPLNSNSYTQILDLNPKL